mgnify:CR=1 FL=1
MAPKSSARRAVFQPIAAGIGWLARGRRRAKGGVEGAPAAALLLLALVAGALVPHGFAGPDPSTHPVDEFSLADTASTSPAAIYVTLAGTSVGRGWDSVGHAAGTY